MKRYISSAFVAFALMAWTTMAFAQTTYYVNGTCGDNTWTGTSAVCQAPSGPKKTIQAAIDASVAGDTILVNPGTYVENVLFKGKDVTVKSIRGPLSTIIDGNAAGSCVGFLAGETTAAVLDGFTLVNGSAGTGGGVRFSGSSATVINNIIRGNSANRGAAIFCNNLTAPTILNNLIYKNSTPGGGAGIFCNTSSTPIIQNNTIFGNSSGTGGGAVMVNSASPTITNTICWGNTPDEINVNGGTPVVDYCCVMNGFAGGGTGNIQTDPKFIDSANDDFRIDCSSPCIDAGTTTSVTLLPVDVEGDNRQVDGNSNGGPQPDIGADEFDFLWKLNGPPLIGTSITWTAQAPPAQNNYYGHIFVSGGDGSAAGGITVVPTTRVLWLDNDNIFKNWEPAPFLHGVRVANCPGSSTNAYVIPSLLQVGLKIYFAGASFDLSGNVVSVTPTHSTVIQ